MAVVGTTKKRGTVVHFMPDNEIFTETTDFSFEILSARLRELAFLNKKLRIKIIDARTNKDHEFYFEGGIVSFVEHINQKKIPLFPEVLHFAQEDEKYMLEVALQYNDGYGEQLYSFVNNINTIEGGTHVSGFKSALTKVCNKKALAMNVLKAGESFSSEDVREGLVCVISIKVPEPQFEGQTKAKLGNAEVKGIVDSWTTAYLDTYFEENPSIGRKILQKAEIAKRARDAAKKARELTRRKTVLESAILPGKLADCSDEDPIKTELFIVEGDSAGGSAKQGRDRNVQAILPLKGKILNVEKARIDRILSNEEIKALITAIGCGIGEEFDANKARYHKIILMTDADVDGSHIRTLLLTFFFRYMKQLIEKGYLYIAQPPLYKAKIGKKEQYLKDDKAFKQFLFDWAEENTTLFTEEKELDASSWKKSLAELLTYDDLLAQVSPRFTINKEYCHRLVMALAQEEWKKGDDISKLIPLVQPYFKEWKIVIEHPSYKEATEQISEDETIPESYLVFNIMNITWKVSLSFFSSAEVKNLIWHLNPLLKFQRNEWKILVTGKDKYLNDTGVSELIQAISSISKPYMTIQRYKGLGEMNADQLWETAMDPENRSLLRVTIEDALEADSWFSTLMGDDVQGRKDYIETYGQFAKNLDI